MKSYQKLTETERNFVESKMSIVEIVVKTYIKMNADVNGLGYEDLLQEGMVALCIAAKTFNGSVKFETYASRVIRNHLIDSCRKACQTQKRIIFTEMEVEPTGYEDKTNDVDSTIDLQEFFGELKKQYSGCLQKGIECLELKSKGYSGTEIAKLYNTEANKVGAWISLAAKKIRSEELREDLLLRKAV